MDEEGKFAAFNTNYYCYKDALVTARVCRREERGREGGGRERRGGRGRTEGRGYILLANSN